MPASLRPVLAAVAALALVVTTIGWITQWQRANELEERNQRLAAEVRELRAEVERLEGRERPGLGDLLGGDVSPREAAELLARLLEDEDTRELLGEVLGRLLGDGQAVDELLEGLSRGDLGGLGELLGDGASLDGLLGELLGGDAGLDGLLGPGGAARDLLAGGVPGAECTTPADSGLLDGLFGDGADPLPDDPETLVGVVADHVAELRGLDWREEVEVAFVDGAELADRLDVLLAEDTDLEALAAEQRLLAALGAVPDDLDLEAVQRQLLDEQVAGYYVPDTGELVVRVPDDGRIRPLDRVTLAHELLHALTDQVHGLPDLREEPYASDADAALGALAMIEGDATLLMNLWAVEHLSLTEQLSGLFDGDLGAAQASLASVPHHLQRELLFPYTAGLAFTCAAYLDGGWDAVDDAYADPPDTSVEVLHPERAGEEPAEPPQPRAPADARELLATTFGAAPLQWLFEAPGGDVDRALSDPGRRAAAWAGGTVVAWDLDGDTAVSLGLVDRGDGPSLCHSLVAWHAAAFPDERRGGRPDATVFRGDDGAASVRCEDDTVRYARAGDLTTALGITARR